MGLGNVIYGYCFAVLLVTLPQLLRARGMGVPAINGLIGLANWMCFTTFFLAPIFDTLISRRAWAIATALTAAGLSGASLLVSEQAPGFTALVIGTALAIFLYTNALGGWLGAALPNSCDDTVATWFTIGNSMGFGLGALVQHWLVVMLPAPYGPLAVAGLAILPMALFALIPAGDNGRKAVRESFAGLAGDVIHLVRQPLVLRVGAMFLAPCAAFTLTNAFSSLGPDFHASDRMVDTANGIGALGVGFAASLLTRLLLKRVAAPLVYIGIGVAGAAFTCALVGLPRDHNVYLLGVLGENAAQSIAQVAQNAITFRSIRQGSPLAASQFGLLFAAAATPYAYMQQLDGHGYALTNSVTGQFLMDAGISLAACALLAIPVWRWMKGGKLQAAETAGEPIPQS